MTNGPLLANLLWSLKPDPYYFFRGNSMSRFILAGLCFSSMLIAGCGGTEELPPTSGGKNSASDEEIKKQMEESMKKSGGQYKGKMPGQK